jgi:hypothetical protein
LNRKFHRLLTILIAIYAPTSVFAPASGKTFATKQNQLTIQEPTQICSKVYTEFQKTMGKKLISETWIETTADDNKPLFIDLGAKEDHLFLTFFKTKEGVWAEGNAEICPEQAGNKNVADKWVAKITKADITVGKIAPWPVRLGFSGGAKFKLTLLEPKKLKIATTGWSGEFVPATKSDLKTQKDSLINATP